MLLNNYKKYFNNTFYKFMYIIKFSFYIIEIYYCISLKYLIMYH